jgi:Uma2 family endonuclease
MQVKQNTISPHNYLVLERKSDLKHEYCYNTIIEMAGASKIHNYITIHFLKFLLNYLSDSQNEIFGSDMRVYNPLNESYFYPDIVVTKGESETIENDNLINPLLIVEVISPSTAVFDKTDKFIAYRSIKTLQEYVLVYTELPQIEIFRKTASDEWINEIIHGVDKNIYLKSLDCTISLQDIFKKVF